MTRADHRGRRSLGVALAGVVLAAPALAQVEERQAFAPVIGDTTVMRTNCPDLEVDAKAFQAEIDRIGGEALNTDPYFQRAVKQAMLRAQIELRQAGGPEFCADMLKLYGPDGKGFKNIVRAKGAGGK